MSVKCRKIFLTFHWVEGALAGISKGTSPDPYTSSSQQFQTTMRKGPMIDRLLSAFRQAPVVLAALAFVLSGMSAAHTMHAFAGAHNTPPNVNMDHVDSHCDGHNTSAKQRQDNALSCCVSACVPFIVLIEPLNLALDASHGEAVLPPRQDVIVAGNFALPFRPPRQNA